MAGHFAAIVAGILAGFIFGTETGQEFYQLAKCRYVIWDNDPGWGDEVNAIVRNMTLKASDKHRLAERLLSEENGSLVSEGLIQIVQYNHPAGSSYSRNI